MNLALILVSKWVPIRNTVSLYLTTCIPVEVYRRFGRTYYLHLQNQKVKQASNQWEASSGLLLISWHTFSPWRLTQFVPWKVSELLPIYKASSTENNNLDYHSRVNLTKRILWIANKMPGLIGLQISASKVWETNTYTVTVLSEGRFWLRCSESRMEKC
jgi:hypothetical protein